MSNIFALILQLLSPGKDFCDHGNEKKSPRSPMIGVI